VRVNGWKSAALWVASLAATNRHRRNHAVGQRAGNGVRSVKQSGGQNRVGLVKISGTGNIERASASPTSPAGRKDTPPRQLR